MSTKKPKLPRPKACSMSSELPTPKANPKYNPAFCEQIKEYYNEGMADVQICVKLGIARSTFYDWIKDKPEFAKAVEDGRVLSEGWWIAIAQGAVSGKHKSDSKIWSMNMKNRFKWRDNPHPEDNKVRDDILEDIARRANLQKERNKDY